MIKSLSVRLLWSWAIRCCMAGSILYILSCGNKDKVPEGILSQDQMVSVLSELYILEHKITSLPVTRDSLTQLFAAVKGKVFEKSGVTDSIFSYSLNYYVDHPKSLEAIYAVLIDSLNLREQRLISGDLKK